MPTRIIRCRGKSSLCLVAYGSPLWRAAALLNGLQHVAFSVSDADLPRYQANLLALDVEIRPPRSRVEGEGQSLYFYDFDNHLFELHTGTLEQRLARYSSLAGR